jgi:hypothetical protein
VGKGGNEEVAWGRAEKHEHPFTMDFETNDSSFNEMQFGSGAPFLGWCGATFWQVHRRLGMIPKVWSTHNRLILQEIALLPRPPERRVLPRRLLSVSFYSP